MDPLDNELDPEAKQRRFDRLVEAITSGDVEEEDLTDDDLDLLRAYFGERADDLQDLLEHLRRIGAEGA